MLTSKQRAYLKGLAANENAIIQVGKGGLNDNLIKTVSDALTARELIKITVLETAGEEPRAIMDALCSATGAEGVQAVGRRIILYRENEKDKKIVLPKNNKR